MFTNKSVEPLPPLSVDIDKELGPDLALHRPINASNVRKHAREFGAEKAVDADDRTYWATDDDAKRMTLEIDMEGPVEINALVLGEAAGMTGRVRAYKVEGQ